MNATAVGGQNILHIILLALNCFKRIASWKIERCGLYLQPSHYDCAYHFLPLLSYFQNMDVLPLLYLP